MKNIFGKIITAVSGVLLLSALTGCEEYLRENSRTDLNMGQITNIQELGMLLNGVYYRLQNCYNSNCIAVGELGTDFTMTTKTTNASNAPIDAYTLTSSCPATSNYWKAHYTLIRDANNVLAKTEELMKEGIINEMEAIPIVSEARFLRGFAYFRLMEAFGELPIIDTKLQVIGTDEFKYPRKSINEVFHFIEADLKYGNEQGGLYGYQGGRANKWAAEALLAKVYLYVGTSKLRNQVGTPYGGVRGDNGEEIPGGATNLIPGYNDVTETPAELFAAAKTLLEDVINNGGFTLVDDYHHVFYINNKNNSESIWEVQFSSEPGYGSSWSKQFGVNGETKLTPYSAVCGNFVFTPTINLYRTYKAKDTRRDVVYSRYKLGYFDYDKWVPGDPETIISKTTDIFNYSNSVGSFVNPQTGNTLQYDLKADLTRALPEYVESACVHSRANKQSGTWKYGWSTTEDSFQWRYESMAFDENNCPNNVIVLRYPDVLFMYAEVDMLLNGADPSKPGEAHASQQAVDYVNMVVNRAMHGQGHAAMVEEYRADLDARIQLDSTTYKSKLKTYEEGKIAASDKNYAALQVAQKDLDDDWYQYEHIEDLVINTYTTSTLTYEALINERGMELWGEFHRWFDLQRLGWLEYKVLARKAAFSEYPAPQITIPTNYLYPLPLTDLDLSLNPDFRKNNPGYAMN